MGDCGSDRRHILHFSFLEIELWMVCVYNSAKQGPGAQIGVCKKLKMNVGLRLGVERHSDSEIGFRFSGQIMLSVRCWSARQAGAREWVAGTCGGRG